MPSITELTIYPIKSCAGISVSHAELTEAGLRYQGVNDREWMLVNLQGQFLSQRELPAMARLRPTIQEAHLQVTAPHMPPLTIPLLQQTPSTTREVMIWDCELIANDEGDRAADWFSQSLGTPCRLVRFAPEALRFASSKWTGEKQVPTRFSDGYPMLLISQASLDDLNHRSQLQGRTAVPMNRFRPNIVIDGIDAFEEDYAESYDIGDIQLRPVKPCPRCPMPAVDQLTGEIKDNPVDVLQSYRANPIVDGEITFGMNVILEKATSNLVQVGDAVEMPIAF